MNSTHATFTPVAIRPGARLCKLQPVGPDPGARLCKPQASPDVRAAAGRRPAPRSYQRGFALISGSILLLLPLAAAEPVILERGPNHKRVQTVTERVLPAGKVVRKTNSYVELETGMHFLKDGQWNESREEIEVLPTGGALARHGAHKVLFGATITGAGGEAPITLEMADGQVLRSRILGLVYVDVTTGKSALIAELKESVGEMTGNVVIYPDAFDDVAADVRLTYTKSGFEQDILIRRPPAPPDDFGIPSKDARLQVWTEFFQPPAPVKSDTLARAAGDKAALADQHLDFGPLKIGAGRAFTTGLGEEEAEVVVGKEWAQSADGRSFLIETADYEALAPMMDKLRRNRVALPAAGQPIAAAQPAPAVDAQAALARLELRRKNAGLRPAFMAALPRAGLGKRADAGTLRTAKITSTSRAAQLNAAPAVVLDYITMASATNYVFKGDETHFVVGQVNLSGTTVIEAGAVIKFTNGTATTLKLLIQGPIDCQTSPNRPAVFTSKDDDRFGAVISGSSGSPSGYYGGRDLELSYSTSPNFTLHNVRFFYAQRALYMNSGHSLTLSHAIFAYGNSSIGNFGNNLALRNVLCFKQGSVVASGTNTAENCTFHRIPDFGASTTKLTNCLVIAVTNNVPASGSNNYTNRDESGIFQTAGAFTHYLAASSAHRDAGTTGINADLLTELRKRTTHPPLTLTNSISVATTLSPQAQRDTDTLDLGYHPELLDYVASGVALSSTLTLTNGVVIGVDSSVTNYGFRLDTGATLISEGSPVTLNRFVRTHAIGDTASAQGSSPTTFFANANASSVNVRCRFTDFPMIAGGYYHFKDAGSAAWTPATFTLQDCQFGSGNLVITPASGTQVIEWKNNLFDRTYLEVRTYAPITLTARHNLFRGGNLTLSGGPATPPSYTLTDNLFDKTTITCPAFTTYNAYNGYVTNQNQLCSSDGGDVILMASPAYETGTLGRFYLPTNSPLINFGSDQASLYGLYHHTVTTNQTKDAATQVDIGWHLIATDANGNPLDTDGDGLPDWWEDTNGNGSVNGTETDWQNYHDGRFRVVITRPRSGSVVP